MEEDSLIAQIASDFYIVLAVAIVFYLLVGWLTSLDIQVQEAQRDQYRQAAIMENILELDANNTEMVESGIEPYNYTEKRASIPVEYFTETSEDRNDEIGYRIFRPPTRRDHCYLPEVPQLDGENFAYRLDVMNENADTSELPDRCIKQSRGPYSRYEGSVFSQALLVRENLNKPDLPVRIYVYSVE